MGNCQSPPTKRVSSARSLKRAGVSMSSLNSSAPEKVVRKETVSWESLIDSQEDEQQTQGEASSDCCSEIVQDTSMAMTLNIKMDNRTLQRGEFLWGSGRSFITSYSAEE